ncbi:MAG: hypothetical protein AUJ49_07930 [Desulfovibrionaceae bacterium CG1_02_65_16]|nr:MAG: hypothetical protein AUJ49_07930 [Desulfovibrionaceae bacterium CG1_02_65_16]
MAQLTHGERVARRFGSRAADYDEHAVLQRQTAARLAAFVDERGGLYGAEQADGLVAEVGCGTGLLSTLLAPRAARYLATDIAPEMLERCRSKLTETLPDMEFSVLNGEGTCFAETPAVIVSNLTAQWFRAPASGLAHLAGQTPRLFFAVPLAGSFPEWEQAFADLGRASGLLSLPEESLLREVLCALPDRAAHFQTDEHVIHYADARAFAESFRRIGADTPRPGYTPRPIRAVLQRFGSGMDASARVLYGCITKESA